MIPKKIIFISNTVYPTANSGGGSIVLYRHLKRFENEGWDVVCINSLPNNSYSLPFKEIHIKRQWWFLPLRRITPLLTTLRCFFYSLLLKPKLTVGKNDVVISILGEYINLLAYEISKQNNIPLFMFYHDDSLFNDYRNENLLSPLHIKKLFKQTQTIFAVSVEMVDLLKASGAENVVLLYPIPNGIGEQNIEWEHSISHQFTLAYSGMLINNLHSEIISFIANGLKKTNGELQVITNNKQLETSITCSNLKFVNPLKTHSELFDYFYNNVSCLLVFYSFKTNLEHRLHSSFPSKFVEYCHLGLPVLIVAPPESAITKWAYKNNWLALVDEMNEEILTNILNKLKDKIFWEECKTQSLKCAQTSFDPEEIHSTLKIEINHSLNL